MHLTKTLYQKLALFYENGKLRLSYHLPFAETKPSFCCKTTLFILLLLQATSFIYSINEASSIVDNAQILAAGLNVLIFFFIIILHHLEYTRNNISSGVLLFYWLFDIIAGSIKLRTLIISHGATGTHEDNFAMYLIRYALSVSMFILENIPKPKCQYVMLEEADDAMESSEEKNNIFGRLTFSWLTPLMRLGYKRIITDDDLWNLSQENQAQTMNAKFQKNWQNELKKERPSLFRALAFTLGRYFMIAAPMLLSALMAWVASHLTDDPQPAYRGIMIALGMFVTAVSQTMFLHQYFQTMLTAGMKMRAALVTSIYQKTLLLNNTSRQQSTVGEIVNRMSVDAQRLMDLCSMFHICWSGPFQIMIALYLLYRTMGPSIWGGVTILLLAIPLNTLIAKTMRQYQKFQMGNKDARVKLMNEILNGIKVIKLYAWESPFIEKVSFIRNDLELTMLKKIGFLQALQSFTWTSIPFFVSIVTFAIYILASAVSLTSQVAFVAISLFGLLQFPMAIFPNVITSMIEASVSLKRIENYLLSEELDTTAIKKENFREMPSWNSSVPLLEIKNADFKWDAHVDKMDLVDINFSLKKGTITAVVGKVGAGKSTLISAILGDNVKTAGEVTIRGSVAYAPQQPWIMNATVRDNITFGLRYEPVFYDKVIEACALKPDLRILANGDLTEIGERGINLSGGQKARISLARAVYSRADIYLFDDPLSAVDAHVGKHIFERVLGPNGSYDDLMAEKGELSKLITEFVSRFSKEELGEVDDDDMTLSEADDASFELLQDEVAASLGACEEESALNKDMLRQSASDRRVSMASALSHTTLRRGSIDSSIFKDRRVIRNAGNRVGQLMTTEESVQGKVSWSVYKQYAQACSIGGVLAILMFQLFSQAAQVSSNVWLKHWSAKNTEADHNNSAWVYLAVYALIGWSSTIFAFLQTLSMWVFCAIRSAKFLHSSMLESVMRSPMSFFDTTPLGRILNRFSKDEHTIDEILPRNFNMYIRVLYQVIATVLIITFSTLMVLLLIIPLLFVYLGVQRYYLATSRALKRLDAVGKSPIYSHFQETIQGVSTIRAYDQQNVFILQNQNKLDNNQRAYFPSITCNRWLAVRLEFLGSIIILGSSLFAVLGVLYGSKSYIDPGLVGLSVSYALSVTQALNWVIHSYCDIETIFVDPAWPSQGNIKFKQYYTRYREGLDYCLKDLTFQVLPKEKIGIVGRTGAGKSSLSLTLFRILEAAKGRICIDDVDISSLRLYDLRSKLSIIPQDPVLFAGTVRENLDPFGAYEDVEIWQALRDSHLYEHVSAMDGQLNGAVLEGGDNFSVGQRQLICLARALLRHTNVLILDEATAAIDVETDAIIQETIRIQFADCTVLTIAHRINTVMDSDRILVLDNGTVGEFDTPANLIARPESILYGLAKEAGLIT
ncbi:multi drug resistance-associated protein MRP [Mycotypha africana]|uniref:multi drug resistance-associated protein MRP n=1 Tax=Mycotypha africana TaxID=64632 RepID=UPI002300EF61|nr:multi drug resistance-associated protein MRP [Mycotypha africana]KAI8987272.1 multi drug resistance-associated protein MRP [Mycotypha africana]